MWLLIAQSVWLFFPTGIANMSASLSRFIPLLRQPVDAGKYWRGRRIFGAHKTWGGLLTGTVAGILFYLLQQYVYQFDFFQTISLLDYHSQPWFIGGLFGLGAVLGDLVKSFFKRRISIEPGKPWIPFDQIDYIVGAIVLLSFIYWPGWKVVVVVLVLGPVLHIMVNLISYTLRLQKNKL